VRGKVVAGVGKRAKKANVPVVAVVGCIGDGADGIYDLGVCSVFTTNHVPEPFELAMLKSHENLRRTARNLLGFLTAMEGDHG
jgi:glycerate kinase